MRHFHLLAASAIAVVMVTGAGSASSAPFTNGSFESGLFTPDGNGASDQGVGSINIARWIVYNDTVSWIQTPNSFFITASPGGGAYFLDLTGYHDNGSYAGVKQNFDTNAGAIYNVTFDLGSARQYGQPVSIAVSAGSDSQIFTSTAIDTDNTWETQHFSFTATGSTTQLSFIGTAGRSFIGLDNVIVEQGVAGVPEPAAWALMLSGFGLAGAALRRRRAVLAA